MIVIVDNGKAANDIKDLLRLPSTITKPDKIPKGMAYILTDGALDAQAKKANEDLIKTTTSPVLGVGLGATYVLSAFGARIKKTPVKKAPIKASMKKPCPLLLDLKRFFSVVCASGYTVSDLPDNFDVAASSKESEFEIAQEIEKPFFAIRFNPEAGGDGKKIINNFANFVEMWEKHHK